MIPGALTHHDASRDVGGRRGLAHLAYPCVQDGMEGTGEGVRGGPLGRLRPGRLEAFERAGGVGVDPDPVPLEY